MRALKNAVIYKIAKPLPALKDLAQYELSACPASAHSTTGWVADENGEFSASFAGSQVLLFGENRRILPPKVIQQSVDNMVEQIQKSEGRGVGRQERGELRELAIFKLLPVSHVELKITQVLIADRYIYVDTASIKHADEVIQLLRKAVPAADVVPITGSNLSVTMTKWVADFKPPAGYELTEHLLAVDPRDGSKSKFKGLALDSEPVSMALAIGECVKELGIEKLGEMQLVVTDDMVLKQIKLDSNKLEVVDFEAGGGQKLEAQGLLIIQAASLHDFVTDFVRFGGE